MKFLEIKDALILLENDYVLESYENNERIIFVKKDNKVNIASTNYNLMLNFQDFKENYKDFKFYPIENKNNDTLDLEKDNEYYNRIQKRQ